MGTGFESMIHIIHLLFCKPLNYSLIQTIPSHINKRTALQHPGLSGSNGSFNNQTFPPEMLVRWFPFLFFIHFKLLVSSCLRPRTFATLIEVVLLDSKHILCVLTPPPLLERVRLTNARTGPHHHHYTDKDC